MRDLAIAIAILATEACKGEPNGTPPTQAASGSAVAQVADAGVVADAALIADALRAAGKAELVLRADGVGPLSIGMVVDKDSLAALLPDYTIEVEQHYFEDTPYDKYAIKKGDEVLVRITPTDGVVYAINITSALVKSELGFKVGMKYEKVVAAIGKLSCEVPPHDDPFSSDYICVPESFSSMQLGFPIGKYPKGKSDGFDLSAKRAAKLLHAIELDEIFINTKIAVGTTLNP